MVAASDAFSPRLQPGSGEIAIQAVAGESTITRAIAASPLRLVPTRARGPIAWVFTTTLGGGLVDGDAIDLSVRVGPGARGLVTTQASTKAYRSPNGARQRIAGEVAEGGVLAVVNDPLVPFRDASHRSEVDVSLAPGGSALVVDAFTAGRVEHGERWAFRSLATRLRLVLGEKTLIDERMLLDPRHGDVAARMDRFDVLATILLAGPLFSAPADELARTVASERVRRAATCLVSASRVEGGILFRVASTSVERALAETRSRLAPALLALGIDPWSRRP